MKTNNILNACYQVKITLHCITCIRVTSLYVVIDLPVTPLSKQKC